MNDCPLAPNKEYRQGQPDGCIVTVSYIAPCKDWDGIYCNWFEPPMAVRQMVKFIDDNQAMAEKSAAINTSIPSKSQLKGIAPKRHSGTRRGING